MKKRTKVYILEGYHDYEGSDTIGIFSTRQGAQRAEIKYSEFITNKRYDSVSIIVIEVNRAYVI